jgi:hypothetical protein
MVPTTLSVAKKVNEQTGRYFFKSLFDSGGTSVMINRRCLPTNCEIFEYDGKAFATTQGTFVSPGFVYLSDLALPDFTLTRRIKKIKAYLFDAPTVRYDIIYGRSFLSSVGIYILCSSKCCTWLQQTIPFHPIDYFGDKAAMRQLLTVETIHVKKAEAYLADMIATKESSADVRDIADAQHHLTPQQREELYEVIAKRQKLFNGGLGCYTGRKFHIKLKEGTVPFHCKQPYSIPVDKQQLAKEELERQCEIGVLQKVYESKWGIPMLVIPKKDGSIRTS